MLQRQDEAIRFKLLNRAEDGDIHGSDDDFDLVLSSHHLMVEQSENISMAELRRCVDVEVLLHSTFAHKC